MLHVLNGDATRSPFEAAGLVGDVLIWRDILVEGPVTTSDDAVPMLEARVEFLSARLAIEQERYARSAHEQAAALEAARAHDEVVLWFEQDLFCAVNLWRLLDWFGRRPPMPRLSLVYPSTDEIKGLGGLEPGALAALFAARVTVTDEMLALGRRAWAAYAGPDPLDTASLVDAKTAAYPSCVAPFAAIWAASLLSPMASTSWKRPRSPFCGVRPAISQACSARSASIRAYAATAWVTCSSPPLSVASRRCCARSAARSFRQSSRLRRPAATWWRATPIGSPSVRSTPGWVACASSTARPCGAGMALAVGS